MSNQNKYHFVFFCFAIVLLSWSFHYFEIFNYAPHATHSWRQTDSTSFAQNYYEDGLNFFSPRIHHLERGEGFVCPSEFPILYYLTASIWSIFSPHDGVLRLLNFLILVMGLFSISKVTLKLTNDVFYALAIPLLLMGSPIIAFYGFNFLPNGPAFGLALMGVSFFFYFYKTKHQKWLLGSGLLFLLGGLLKVTILVPFIALFIIFLLEKINLIRFKSEKIFPQKWWVLPFFIGIFLIIGCWMMWVKNYNLKHDSSVFITQAKPIWNLSAHKIKSIWEWILRDGAPQYYHFTTRYLIFVSTVILLFFLRKKQSKFMYLFNLLIVLGTLGIFLLLYQQFFIHDYYVIDNMILPTVIFISSFYILKKHFPKIGNHILTKTLIGVFIIFNLWIARLSIEERSNNAFSHIFNPNYQITYSKKMEAQAFLKELGITRDKKVLTVPDVSPNFNLNYFNLKGWSEFAMPERPFPPNTTKEFIKLGAEYLIITDEKYLNHKHFKPFTKYPLGNFENAIFVFDLRTFE